MSQAVKTKDKLYNAINSAKCLPELVEVATKILEASMLLDGLWAECNYCYKVVDLCNLIENQIQLLGDDEQCYPAPVWELKGLVRQCRQHFYNLQQDMLQAA